MLTKNPWSRWNALNPSSPSYIGEVISEDHTNGTSVVRIPPHPEGELMVVSGVLTANVGDYVLVQDDEIKEVVPTLTFVQFEV